MQSNVSLKKYNTFGIDVKADFFYKIKSIKELQEVLLEVKSPLFILGGGSNILLTKDVKSCVLKNELRGISIVEDAKNEVLVAVRSGENWHRFVLWCIDKGLGGIENLSLIPGTVGAAPIQNIGAYGVELQDVFVKLEALSLKTGELKVFTKEDCRFGYRESIFKQELKGEYFITKVFILLKKEPDINIRYGAIQEVLQSKNIQYPTIKDVSDAVISIRQSKLPDPKVLGNSGSFFKNPTLPKTEFLELQKKFPDIVFYELPEKKVKIPAGWLIEKAGWKGKKIGNTGSHAHQSLVLVNYGNATGEEVKKLSDDIISSISEMFGIQLSREVNIVGGE